MAISQETKDLLIKLKNSLSKTIGPEVKAFDRSLDVIAMNGISTEDLKALCNPAFVIGVDFSAIDTTVFTTEDMNAIAPGAIDVKELKAKLSPVSLLQGRTTDILDTQLGVMALTTEVRINVDIEDTAEGQTKSQGINLQLENRAKNINKETVSGKSIKSRFLE